MFSVRCERGFLVSGGLFIWINIICPHKEKGKSQYDNLLHLHYDHLFCYLDLEILIKASVSISIYLLFLKRIILKNWMTDYIIMN